MARPVEYDLEKVLDTAMELFWQKGYENVSMADLVSHTGLNRRTMYSLFNDKEGIFKDALDNYYTKRASQRFSVLTQYPGKKGLVMFLKSFQFDNNFKGCLFNNCMGKQDFMSSDSFNIPKEYFERLRLQIEKNLQEALIKKDFNGDVQSVALIIMTIIHGFNVYGQYNQSKEDGDIIINNVLKMIA